MNETIKSLELQDDENPDKKILLIGGSRAAGVLLHATAAFGNSVKKVLCGIKASPASTYPKKAKKGRSRS